MKKNVQSVFALLMVALLLLSALPSLTFAASATGTEPTETYCPSERNGHEHWFIEDGRTEPTCVKPGRIDYHCAYCNYEKRETIPALGHNWSDWYVVTPPAMEQPGLEERKCKRCGLTEQRKLPPLAPYEDYALRLSMPPQDYEEIDYPDTTIPDFGEVAASSWYPITIMNVGKNPVYVRECVDPYTGQRVPFSDSDVPYPLYLEPGESFTVYKTLFHSEPHIDKSKAHGNVVGTIDYLFKFFGSDEEGAFVCTSNSVSYSYRVIDVSEPTGWIAPDETDVSLSKQLFHDPADPSGFQLGETIVFSVVATNTGAEPIEEVKIYDPLTDGSAPFATVCLDPGESYPALVSHTVTLADVAAHYVENVAYVEWGDEDLGTFRRKYSNHVVVSTTTKTDLLVTKTEVSLPANGTYYVPGEEIIFEIYLKNNSPAHLYQVVVHDPALAFGPGGSDVVTTIEDIGPGEEGVYEVHYIVTALDAEMGYLRNVAWAEGKDEAGNVRIFTSNEVWVPTGFEGDPPTDPGDPFGVIWDLALEKIETSTPVNGLYYTPGETIQYTIRFTNVSEQDITEGILYDALKAENYGEIGAFELLHPGETREVYYSHTVTEADAQNGWVMNYAYSIWLYADEYYFSKSNEVYSPTNSSTVGLIPPVVWQDDNGTPSLIPPITFAEGEDSCKRTLVGKNDMAGVYTLHLCGDHNAVAEEVQKLVAKAETQNEAAIVEAWKQAKALWEEELNELYDVAFRSAGARNRSAVLADRTAFYAYLNTYEALLGNEDPILTAKRIAEAVENRCADLCYDLHNVGKQRADSVDAEHETITETMDYSACTTAVISAEDADTQYAEILCTKHRATETAAMGLLAETKANTSRTAAWKRIQSLRQVDLDALVNMAYKAADADVRKIIAKNRVAFDKLAAARMDFLALFYPEAAVAEQIAHLYTEQLTIACDMWK